MVIKFYFDKGSFINKIFENKIKENINEFYF